MAGPRNIVVTAADEKYAQLAIDLIQSLEPWRKSLDYAVGCLDLGLSPQSADSIRGLGATVIEPEWRFRPHEVFSAKRKYLSRAARPFLRESFPGHAVYIWIDADAWVQHPEGLHWLIQSSKWAQIAAVPTLHRSYAFSPIDVAWLRKRYTMAFGEEAARKLMNQTYFNSGVFAMPAASPVWQRFIDRFQEALDQWDGEFLSDQAVLNAVVHLDAPKFERLPAKVNWICHLARPRWDQARQMLVEPNMPFEPISIIHNTFNDKTVAVDITALNGAAIRTPMTYRAIRQLRTAPPAGRVATA